jgi:regulator of replication initiation timing
MDTELESLEKKVDQLLRLYQDTQLENVKLRQKLSETDTKNKKLAEKINIAADKLETILIKISEKK